MICYGHWFLHLVLPDTRQGVRFVTGIGFCILCYQTPDRGYDLLRASGSASCVVRQETGGTICWALGSASCVIRHQTGGTICYGHWVLHLVLSDTRQGVRFVTGIGFCILSYQTRDRGYDLLGLGFCIWCHQTPDGGYDLLRALDSAFCVIRHDTEDRICYRY